MFVKIVFHKCRAQRRGPNWFSKPQYFVYVSFNLSLSTYKLNATKCCF